LARGYEYTPTVARAADPFRLQMLIEDNIAFSGHRDFASTSASTVGADVPIGICRNISIGMNIYSPAGSVRAAPTIGQDGIAYCERSLRIDVNLPSLGGQ